MDRQYRRDWEFYLRIIQNKRATILWSVTIIGIPLAVALAGLSIMGVPLTPMWALLFFLCYLPFAVLMLLSFRSQQLFSGRGRKVFVVARTVFLCLFGLVVVTVVVPSCLPMGDGSPRYARKWSTRLAEVSSPQQARELYDQAGVREFTNGDWLVWVSDNSHGNPWGGTVVTKDNRSGVRAFYGHVCGRAFVHGDTLEDAYRYLDDFYGSSPADYRRKHSHR